MNQLQCIGCSQPQPQLQPHVETRQFSQLSRFGKCVTVVTTVAAAVMGFGTSVAAYRRCLQSFVPITVHPHGFVPVTVHPHVAREQDSSSSVSPLSTESVLKE